MISLKTVSNMLTVTNRVPRSISRRASKQLLPDRVRPYLSRIEAGSAAISKAACLRGLDINRNARSKELMHRAAVRRLTIRTIRRLRQLPPTRDQDVSIREPPSHILAGVADQATLNVRVIRVGVENQEGSNDLPRYPAP